MEVNEYRMEELLGAGSFGRVYRATKTDTGETVAVKVLRRSVLKRQRVGRFGSALDTLLREIAVMKKINHPNCVRLYEVIDSPAVDMVFLVMEHVDGGVLSDAMEGGPIEEDVAIAVARDVSLGLAYLHQQGIVHRDVKPENMLLFHRRPSHRASDAAGAAPAASEAAPEHSWAPGNASRKSELCAPRRPSELMHAGRKSLAVARDAVQDGLFRLYASLNKHAEISAALAHGRGGELHVKLCDFGVATIVDGAPESEERGSLGGARASFSAAEATAAAALLSSYADAGGGASRKGSAAPAAEAGAAGGNPAASTVAASSTASSVAPNKRSSHRTSRRASVERIDVAGNTGGSPAFWAPEMCVPGTFNGVKADLWALGISLYALLYGTMPYSAPTAMLLMQRIRDDPVPWPGDARRRRQQQQQQRPQQQPPPPPSDKPRAPAPPLSDECVDFLAQLLRKEPEHRATMEAVLTHPWLTRHGEAPLEPPLADDEHRIVVDADEFFHALHPKTADIVLRAKLQFLKTLVGARAPIGLPTADSRQFLAGIKEEESSVTKRSLKSGVEAGAYDA